MSEPNWVALGQAGVTIDYIGAWSVGTTYKPGDVVVKDGIQYLAVNPSTGQTPPPAAYALGSVFDAKGDLVGATGNDAPVRIPVGTDGQALVADSASAPGVKWGNVGVRQLIPIRLRVPRSSTLGGNSAFSVTALSQWDMAAWEFADALDGRIYGHCKLPTTLAATPDCKLRVTYAASVAGNVALLHRCHRAADGVTLNPPAAFGTVAWGTGYLTIAAGYVIKELVSGAFACAGGETLIWEIIRWGADAGDTLAGTLYLLDAYVEVSV
jgi:hypothetical protein